MLTVMATACAARGGVPRPFPGAALPPSATAEPTHADSGVPHAASGVVSRALAFLGTPYRNGGSEPSGFDCSGLIQYVYRQEGLSLPREVSEQYRIGRKVPLREVRPGDLLFFETVSRGASHVAIAIGGDQFVHAPSSKGVVRVERLAASYWAKRFVGARRVG
ncbi:MAG: C40 family peptidase [Vicinamibacterales bacterium]